MKILVTGATGQLARSLVAAPAPAGINVQTLGRPQLDMASNQPVGAIIEAEKPDLIVNAAAYTAVDKAEIDSELAMTINGFGAGLVAEACRQLRIPIIQISTDYVFDGRKPEPYNERDSVAPLGAYGRSKLDGEFRVKSACPQHIILRTSWVFSPYGTNFVKTMLELGATRSEIAVVNDQLGTPTYAPHLADVILGIANRLRDGARIEWGIYHAAGSGEATWYQLARETFRLSQKLGGARPALRPITSAEYPTRARRPSNSRLDSGKLEQSLGVQLPDWHEGLAACVRILQEPHIAPTSSSLLQRPL